MGRFHFTSIVGVGIGIGLTIQDQRNRCQSNTLDTVGTTYYHSFTPQTEGFPMKNQDKPFVWYKHCNGSIGIYHDRTKEEMKKLIVKEFEKRIGYKSTTILRGVSLPGYVTMEPKTYQIVMCTKDFICVHSQDGGLNINGVDRESTHFVTTYRRMRTE